MKNSKFKTQNSKLQTNFGFTLIEILVASYIFAIVILAGTAIFSSSIGAKMKANIFWKTQQESRYAMEKIVKTIRNEEIKGFSFGVTDNSILYLCQTVDCSLNNARYKIYLSSANSAIYIQENPNSLSSKPAVQLTSDDVKVTKLQFDGFYPSVNSKMQPYINIAMTLRNTTTGRATEKDTLNSKTTINFRNYGYKYGH